MKLICNATELCDELSIGTPVFVAGIQVEDTSFGNRLSDSLENNKKMLSKKVDLFIAKSKKKPHYERH